MDLLKSFRVTEPILFFLILWILIGALAFLVRGKYKARGGPFSKYLLSKGLFVANIGFISIIFSYFALVIAYIFSHTFFDQAEPNIAAVSWLFKSGKPLFPPMDSAERYINNYGAVLYIVNRFFLEIFGSGFVVVKLGCGLAAILSVICIFYATLKVANRQIALIACAYAVLAFLSITNSFAFHAASFWLRPDPLLIFFVSAALLSVLRGNRPIATLVTAIAFGCSLNLKINAFVNFLPIYILLLSRFGLATTLISVVGAIATAGVPFIASSQISLSDYLIWLSQSRNKPASFVQLIDVCKWVFYISLPILLSLGYLYCRSRTSLQRFIQLNRGFIHTLLGCVIASLAFSIKIGVLENNHLPFIPLFAYLLALILEWIRTESHYFPSTHASGSVKTIFMSAALAFSLTMALAIAPEAGRLVSTLIKSPSQQIIGDINNVMKAHPNSTIGMGFSQGDGNYELTFYRPVLVFAGNPYLVDPVIMFEMQVSGVKTVSDATIKALQTCQTQIWLLPNVTKTPFDFKNFYPPHDLVFPEEFRHVFLQTYQPIGESEFYELWACKQTKT